VKRLAETHGRQFELVRHFLRRMFDGEWSSSPGQWKSAAVGAVSLFLPAGLLLIREGALDPRYASKYRLLAMTAGPDALRGAAIADELALLTLVFCVTGLIALLEWQSLFPSGRDYLALASLPVKPRQVFTARFLSVLIFSAAIITAMNLLPSLIAPIEFGGGWRIDSSYLRQAGAQALASSLACFFVFFAMIALQGVLLNCLPARLFTRVSVYAQGALAGVFLLGGFYSWSIKEWKPAAIARLPEYGAWLPPVWFSGLRQTLAGDRDPFCAAMAQRAYAAAGIALTLAICAYLISYRRYRKLLLESPARLAAPGVWRWSVIRLLARSPRREAAMDFMIKTLVRSRTHRLLWLVYLGAAAAVLLNSSLIDGALVMRSNRWNMALQFVVHFWPLACSVVLLNGFRHVLSIPAELRANWIFQMTESQGRAEWMSAVERFVIAYAVAPIYLTLFPVAGAVLGWPMALRMTILQLLVSLTMFEALFYSWQKLPFTCSHIPGERPLVTIVAKYMAMLGVIVPLLSVMIAVASQVAFLFVVYLAIFGGLWIWLRRRRREGWGEAKLMYEDLPAVVTDLGIKELTYAGTEAQLRRDAAGDAGHADSQNADSRSDARVRRDGVYSPDLGGRAAGGGGSAVSGAAPAGTAGAAHIGVGRLGEQSQGQVLQPYGGGAQPPRERGEALAQNDGRHRPDHGTGLTARLFGGAFTAARLRLRAVLRRRQLERDLEDELRFHLAMSAQRLREAGAPDSPGAARRRFGNLTSVKETCRDLWSLGSLERLWLDARYGLRQLRVNRAFAVVAAATLSLGIAATTVIYSICAALVWQVLPLPHPETLVTVLQAVPGNAHLWSPSSAADVEDLRRSGALWDGLASWENATAKIVDAGGEPLRVDQARVTANFFDVVGVPPELGRAFAPDEDQPGRDREVVLSNGLWRNRFGADRGIVGRSIRMDNEDYTVIGVMPLKFSFPRASKELWTPLALTSSERNSRSAPRLDSVARLKPGSTLQQVEAELAGLSLRLEALYPDTNAKRRFMAWPVRRYVVGDYAAQFASLLLGAAFFVLLIACGNVASLQFARGTARWREVAIRQSLGASRGRIVIQLVTESMMVAAAGAAAGVALAWFGLRAIRLGMPPELQRYSSGWSDLGLNAGALAFVLAVTLLAGMLAGLAPALRSSRPNLAESLKEGGSAGSSGPGRRRVRSLLLAAEIALTVVLLVGAGLMIRGFRSLALGARIVDSQAVLTLRLDLDPAKYSTPQKIAEFYRELLERTGALPGVQTAAAVSALPYSGHARAGAFSIPGVETPRGKQPAAQMQAVSAAYFQTLHIPLRAGRFLSDRDGPHSPLSIVIDENLARQFWPEVSAAVGRQIKLGAAGASGAPVTIVGVVGGIKASVMDRAPRPTLYLPYTQFPERGMDLAVRCAGDPMALIAAVRSAIRAGDAEEPISGITTLERLKRNEAIGLAYTAVLMSIFGGVALILSCVGVYGITAWLISRQTHEIGIRVALGATRGSVLRLLFRQSGRAALAGVGVGLVLAFALGRMLAAVIWGVSAADAATFAAIPLVLAAVAGTAIYIPARRALAIDPMAALRSE
jgi:putative ABC transport system permease protein